MMYGEAWGEMGTSLCSGKTLTQSKQFQISKVTLWKSDVFCQVPKICLQPWRGRGSKNCREEKQKSSSRKCKKLNTWIESDGENVLLTRSPIHNSCLAFKPIYVSALDIAKTGRGEKRWHNCYFNKIIIFFNYLNLLGLSASSVVINIPAVAVFYTCLLLLN